MATEAANTDTNNIEIPKECKAGVVVNEGPDFRVEIQNVPVPEPGDTPSYSLALVPYLSSILPSTP